MNPQTKQLEIRGSRIIISARKAPPIIRATLSLVLFILFLIPLIVTFLLLSSGSGFHIGVAIFYLLSWGLGIYLLRVILWNSAGREIFTLNPEKISYVADYKFFKDGLQKMTPQNLEIEIIYDDQAKKSWGRLLLKSKNSTIESVLQAPTTELKEIEKTMAAYYEPKQK